jgi:hypothetical protein
MRSSFISQLMLIAFVLPIAAAGSEVESSKCPNIILIVVGDLGFSGLGCYGSEFSTPNLDRLPADGVRLKIINSFSAALAG